MSEGTATERVAAGVDPRRAELARELRERLGPAPQLREAPSVSMVVLTRDGRGHLERLLPGLLRDTAYPGPLELVVVDNGSTDGSVELLETLEAPFPVRLILNAHNETFSDGCNKGARLASGELLLFLNNDIQVLDPDWLVELVTCLRRPGVGIAGSVLLDVRDADADGAVAFPIHHRGLRFRKQAGVPVPRFECHGDDPIDERFGEDIPCPAIAGACMLIARETFEQVGEFSLGYRYGLEDIDLCFKLTLLGKAVVCAGRSFLLHAPGSTRRAGGRDPDWTRQRHNVQLLIERWGPQLSREHDLDLIDGRGFWTGRRTAVRGLPRELVDRPGFCLKAEPATIGEAESLRRELQSRGRRCVAQEPPEWHGFDGLDHDVAIHLRRSARYSPKPGQFNVLWLMGEVAEAALAECEEFDLVLVGRRAYADALSRRLRVRVASLEDDAATERGQRLLSLVENEMERVGFPTRLGPP